MDVVLKTEEAIECGMAKEQFLRLLVLLVEHGIKKEAAAKVCLDLAEVARVLKVTPQLQPYIDLTALQYENIANQILSGEPLPKDPTG